MFFCTLKDGDSISCSPLQVHTVSYNDEGSSDSEHDAYRERMIAEGEERDSEDGEAIVNPRPTS